MGQLSILKGFAVCTNSKRLQFTIFWLAGIKPPGNDNPSTED